MDNDKLDLKMDAFLQTSEVFYKNEEALMKFLAHLTVFLKEIGTLEQKYCFYKICSKHFNKNNKNMLKKLLGLDN